MESTDAGRIAYLVLLLIGVGGWMLVANRRQLGQMAQHAAIWVFIFIGAVAAVGLWSDISKDVAPRASVVGSQIEIPRGFDGHYHLTMDLNGIPVDFVVDTGASDIVLSMQDAQRIGISPDSLAFTGQAVTANGTVRTARIRIPELRIGDITDTNVPASVTEGEMTGSLLGMTYLQRFARIEISGGKMILER